jgi:prepilin-type N-terminal cleavage/methylation domain-containing protein
MSSCRASSFRARGVRGAFTLIELLLTITVLGIAGALVIPSMTQTGVLRVQAAVRTLVADITFVQADAIAFQSRRAIWFGKVPRKNPQSGVWEFVDGNGYTVAEVNGPNLDLTTDAMVNPDDQVSPFGRDFAAGAFGQAVIESPSFNSDTLLIFDELGGPVENLTGPEAGEGGSVRIVSPDSEFTITVAPITGRVSVQRAD